MRTAQDFLEHSDWLRSLARHLVRDPADADDLVQETWATALRSPPDDRTRYRSWLGRVLRNLAIGNARREKRRRSREEIVARGESVVGPEESVQKLEVLRRLVDAVLALEETSRDVVLLRYFEGYSGAEIARRLDLKPSTVRMRLKRALEQLRSELDRTHDGDRSAWHASLLLLIPAGALPPAPASSASASASAGGAPAATISVSGAAAILVVAAAFALGWGSRGVIVEPADSATSPVVVSAAAPDRDDDSLESRLDELRDLLHEAHAALASRSTELTALHARLAVLEDIVDRVLAGNPA